MGFFHIGTEGLIHIPSVLYVAGIKLQREFAPTKLKPVHSLVISQSNDNSMKIADSLSKFFKVSVLTDEEALSKCEVVMQVSGDANKRVQITFIQFPQKMEIGPRITIKRVEWGQTK